MNDADRTDDAPKHRWYQFSLLEMLLITTILAALLGIFKLALMRGTWIDVGSVLLIGFVLFRSLVRLRRKCIENEIWYPDPVETKSDSSDEL